MLQEQRSRSIYYKGITLERENTNKEKERIQRDRERARE